MIKYSLTLIFVIATLLLYAEEVFNPDPNPPHPITRDNDYYDEEYGLDEFAKHGEEVVAQNEDEKTALSPTHTHFHTPEYLLSSKNEETFPHTTPVIDRWKMSLVWKRYDNENTETPYKSSKTQYLWHPYYQSLLKGDYPIYKQDVFLSLTATASSDLIFRDLPTPSGVSASRANSFDFFGSGQQILSRTNFTFRADLFKGETSFKPAEWFVRIQPVFNINYLNVRETGAVSPDPRGDLGGSSGQNPTQPSIVTITNPGDITAFVNNGISSAPISFNSTKHTRRSRSYFALQEAFAEIHLMDLSANYDFLSVKVGNQSFNSDFRGLIFNDTNSGIRFFGNAANNLYQYNAAVFFNREKDTNSELNTFDNRRQTVFIFNMYRQDFIYTGYTTQLSLLGNLDGGDRFHYDKNGFLARPSPLGIVAPHKVHAYYLGWTGDGHIGRWNVSHAIYQAFGKDDFNGIAGHPVDINAQLAVLELSYDKDWVRYKATGLYASGSHNPDSTTARGFDSITDNTNFFGGPFSYYVGQGFNLGGTAVQLTQASSVFPSMTTSKFEGQANFVNPGIMIGGLGTELEITPKWRTSINANYLQFVAPQAVEKALMVGNVRKPIGWDFNISAIHRPVLTDNIIFFAGLGVLLPGKGFKDIYENNTTVYYSGILSLSLTY